MSEGNDYQSTVMMLWVVAGLSEHATGFVKDADVTVGLNETFSG